MMDYQRSLKIGFWALALATFWFAVGQCSSGRVSEGFAEVDAGLRTTLPILEKNNRDIHEDLLAEIEQWEVTSYKQKQDSLAWLLTEQRGYNFSLDSLRKAMLKLAGLSSERPPAFLPLEEHKNIVRQVLLTGRPNALNEMVDRVNQLKNAMISIGDREPVVVETLSGLYNENLIMAKHERILEDLPLTGALAILSDLQVRTSMAMTIVLNYCEAKIGPHPVCIWRVIQPSVSPKCSFVIEGNRYEADVFLGTYSFGIFRTLEIRVNDKLLPVKEGIVHYEEEPLTVGKHSFRVAVTGIQTRRFRDGVHCDTFKVQKEFNYEVGTHSVHLQQPKNTYHLYAGIENPISIDVSAYGSSGVRVTATNAALKCVGVGQYTVLPQSLRSVTLQTGRFGKFTLPVRPLPNPIPHLDGATPDATITQKLLLTQTALQARFPEDFDFHPDCPIQSFHLTRFRPREDPTEADNQGANFNQQVHQLLQTAQPGDRLLFDDIQVQCPGEQRRRTIAPLSLRVQ